MSFFIRRLMRLLDNGINQEAEQMENGKIVLKMNKFYGILGIISVVFSIILAIIAVLSGAFGGEDIVYVLLMLAFFLLIGLLLILYSRNTMVQATAEKIEYTGLTGKSKEMRWNEVNAVSYNPSSKEITLKSGNDKIKLHLHLKGIGSLINIIKQNIDISICEQALNKLGIK